MSGSRPKPGEGRLAEQHLGDRLAALVDGELGHESRDRVLAHLATCAKCKAEADAQRRLKNVFAQAAPPPPSESFLARLQGLPAVGDPADDDMPFGGSGITGGLGGRPGHTGVFGLKRGERFEFGYVPAGSHASLLSPSSVNRGFRIHDVSRHEGDRSGSRGRRFAFAAAGAVSLAAIALGGVSTVTPGDLTADARGSTGTGSNVTPARTPGTTTATSAESQRRRGAGPLLAQTQGPLGSTPVAPTEVSAPLLPGVPKPAASGYQEAVHALAAPVVAGAAAMSPLIRPLSATPPVALPTWSSTPDLASLGLFAATIPDLPSGPSPSDSGTPR
ncbi:anti-sigma factor family protein [Streptomyces sp. NPDC005263]|uniref:anti-sigma factor family protein n=1 Tax=Streptomyces sp. NPDC005263 TaxID=3364711 RepID=UPI0036BCE096